jgi:hypothetical protein
MNTWNAEEAQALSTQLARVPLEGYRFDPFAESQVDR